MGGHGDDRGDRPGHAQPLPRHPGQPPGDHERRCRRAGGRHHRADPHHRGPRLRGRRPLPRRRRRHRGPDRRVDPGRRPVGQPVQHDRHAAALP